MQVATYFSGTSDKALVTAGSLPRTHILPMHSIRALTIGATLLLGSRVAFAQREPKLHTAQPERPSVSTHAGTVSTGWLEIETGIELDNGQDPDHTGLVTLAAKLGIGEKLQLTMLTNAIRATGLEGGTGDVTTGLKWRMLADHPILGDFAVLPSIKMPTGSVTRGTGTGTTDATLLLISSRDLFGADLDVNVGYTFRGGSGIHAPRDSWLWAASLGGDLPHGAGWVVELFGVPGTSGAQGALPLVGLLAGPTFTLRDWLVFDIGGIIPVAGPQAHAFYTGLTWNVGQLWGATPHAVVK